MNVIDPTGLYGNPSDPGAMVGSTNPNNAIEYGVAGGNSGGSGRSGGLGQAINDGINALKNALDKLGKMFSGDKSTKKTSKTNVPGVTHTSSTTKNDDGSTTQTDTYTYTDPATNEEGNSVTITTKTNGDKVEQSYTVTDGYGNVIKSETITYSEGEEGNKQRNVVAVENFITRANKYNAILIVVRKKGVVGAWQGSTLPNNISKYATIKAGVYRMQNAEHNGTGAVSLQTLDGSYQISTIGPNEAQNNQYFAIGIMIHIGYTSDAGNDKGYISNGSEGCQTTEPSGWNSFYNAIGGNSTAKYGILGNYYLSR